MSFFFRFITSMRGRENMDHTVISDPTLYIIETQSQSYTGKIAFQNDAFMKVIIDAEKQKLVKILKQNIRKVTIA